MSTVGVHSRDIGCSFDVHTRSFDVHTRSLDVSRGRRTAWARSSGAFALAIDQADGELLSQLFAEYRNSATEGSNGSNGSNGTAAWPRLRFYRDGIGWVG